MQAREWVAGRGHWLETRHLYPNPNPISSPNPNPNPNSDPDPDPDPHPNKHWTSQKLGWHNTQVMPDPKPSMGDSPVHSVSVVAVVSQRQGRTISVSTKTR